MARPFDDDSQARGPEYHFVSPDDPPDYLLCLICLSVAKSPQQMDCCGKLYCEECLETQTTTCPHCKKTGKSFSDRNAEQDILSLRVKCSNSEKGCQWVGELHHFKEHTTNGCGYNLIPCPSSCGESVLASRQSDQLEHYCLKSQYSSSECGEKDSTCITTKGLHECTNCTHKCPNAGCMFTGKNGDWEMHKCLHETVPSNMTKKLKEELVSINEENKLLAIGTKETQEAYTKLSDEVELYKGQLKQADDRIEELKQENAEMKASLQNFYTNKNKVTFRLFPFSLHKKANTDFYSQPFYTGPYGYKFKVAVYANGRNRRKDTHVSLYIYLMKGVHDDCLEWPFTGSFFIEVLNQLEDKNHYTIELQFLAESLCSQRVMSGELAPTGFGSLEFITHTALACDSSKNCQYLMNNSLYFRVSVQVPEHKPWLE